jgi:hypothetical protein
LQAGHRPLHVIINITITINSWNSDLVQFTLIF